jgi:hypothetical protein
MVRMRRYQTNKYKGVSADYSSASSFVRIHILCEDEEPLVTAKGTMMHCKITFPIP